MADELDLNGVDLNLLVVLDVLLDTGSVTSAARRLGRTQSAVSHALARLRELFADPLFVRSGRGLVATPRAEGLRTGLRSTLVDLERLVVREEAFRPEQSERSFRMACPDLVEALVFPRLIALTSSDAPDAAVVAMPLRGLQVFEALRTGELDVALVPVGQGAPSPAPSELTGRTLLHDRLRVFIRRNHPALADGAMPLDAYCDASHLVVTLVGRGSGPVDDALAQVGRSRRIVARIRSFLSAPHLLARSDLVLTAPASLEALLPPDLCCVDAPLPLVGHRLDMLWHPRMGADPGHLWFREQLERAMAERMRPETP